MFIDSHLHISPGFPDVINTARTVAFVDHVSSVSVFVRKVEKAFWCESMNIPTPLMTLNLPVTYARIRPILLVGEYFVRPSLFTSA